MIEQLTISFIVGVVSSIGTVAALRTDINWIKLTLGQHHDRLTKMENKKC